MGTESFVVTALPHSAAASAPFHVSLFVAHRLTPDDPAGGLLQEFDHVRDWPAALATAAVALTGHRTGAPDVEIACTRVSDVVATRWTQVFPGGLPVAGWEAKDLTGTPWQSFPAHRMDTNALFTHASAILSSPVVAPQPSGLRAFGGVRGDRPYDPVPVPKPPRGRPQDRRTALEVLLDPESRIDERRTRALDAERPGLVTEEPPADAPFSWQQVRLDVHAAKAFYQREEDAHRYVREPVPGVDAPPGPTPPPPEFHQRAGRLGDLSPLLRELGLVLDLRVEDVADLVGLDAISAQVTVPGLDNPVATQPRTRCAVRGGHFTAVSSSGRWDAGMLRLGDGEQFTLLDLDPDASALKLEQYLAVLPRLAALEDNRSEGSAAAPGALRSTGFSIAERHRATALRRRVDDAVRRTADLMAGGGPPLDLEQVTRGLRLEVWDDVSGGWHSLHERLLTVDVEGTRTLDRAPDEGFLQGAAVTRSDTSTDPAAKAYAHEVLAGWDGWSLAAPRPEKAVVHEAGEEVVTDPADLARGDEPVSVTSEVAPGTLPRLRYGRRYSFRAHAVDLAGNSRGPASGASAPGPPAEPVLAAARRLVEAHRRPADGLREPLRGTAAAAPPAQAAALLTEQQVRRLPTALREDAARVVASLEAPASLRVDRVASIQQAFEAAVRSAPSLLERSEASTPPEAYAAALASTITDARGLADSGLPEAEQVAAATDLVTVPRPFLRWAPLIEPAVVPRHPYSWGESLLRMVVRSGVAADGTLTPPDAYAAEHAGHGWRPDSQRHLAPPKTSLLEAELHGRLDEAIGAATPQARRRWLGLALRESGTFVQPTVADPDNPGRTLPVPGLSFHLGESAAPLPGTPVPTPDLLARGDALLPGQYAVHDVDVLPVPYLPDPLATGLSLVFPDADPVLRAAEQAAGRLGVQSLTLDYRGTWPLLDAYRLVLQGGDRLDGVVDGSLATISVPPGEQLRIRLGSAVRPDDLELLGLWRLLSAVVSSDPTLREAAADGWFWWLTPSVDLTLVHAVPRPVEAPQALHVGVARGLGQTTATLAVVARVHAPSTERLDVEARWVEQHDDLAKAGPEAVVVEEVACGTSVGEDERLLVLTGEGVHEHDGFHHFGDTRHRTVDYVLRGSTRYREYFPVAVANGKDDLTRVSAPTRVVVPSTARPAKVVVRDVLPLLVWSDETEAAQPFGTRRTRRSGLRIYLDRPWYTTGDGELLGVVLGETSSDDRPVSEWARDPFWRDQTGPGAAGGLAFVRSAELLGDDPAGQPVGRVTSVRTAPDDRRPVRVLGFRPEYNADRRLWFVDVLLRPGAAAWPFVRLAVARYQPHSLPGCHLGPVVRCDYGQLLPERSLVVARTDDGHVKVALSGAVGTPEPWFAGRSKRERVEASRTVRVRLERRDPSVGTDLGWEVLSVDELPYLSEVGEVVTWAGTVALVEPHGDPARPGRGTSGELRVVVEEVELLLADSPPARRGERPEVRTSSRVVFSDEVVL